MTEEETSHDTAPPSAQAPAQISAPPVTKHVTLNGETVVDTSQAGPR
jgi:hypothetical protein